MSPDEAAARRSRLLAAVGPIAIFTYEPGRLMTADEYIEPILRTLDYLERINGR